MSATSMLNGLACILETFGMEEDTAEMAGAVVENINVTDDFMLLTLEDQNGEQKTFQVVEIDA